MSATLRDATARLMAAGIPDAARDAQKLWDAAHDDTDTFERYIARRLTREPVSHILGRRAFWEHEFLVSSDVLDPRPDTETLVEAALARPFKTVLDLGTGSGCIMLSLLAARPNARGTGTDISQAALAVAQINATRLGVADRATFLISDWLEEVTGQFDLIVSNPPYIAEADYVTLAPEVRLHEPRAALTPDGNGLGPYKILARTAAQHVRAGGALLVEIGHDQGESVPQILRAAGWETVSVLRDLNGKSRVVCASDPKTG